VPEAQATRLSPEEVRLPAMEGPFSSRWRRQGGTTVGACEPSMDSRGQMILPAPLQQGLDQAGSWRIPF